MKLLQIGETFKLRNGKIEYTVVSIFEDNQEPFIVGKHKAYWGGVSYQIFAYDKDGNLYKRS